MKNEEYLIWKPIQELIFDEYENLNAFISTPNWSTGVFLFDIDGSIESTNAFYFIFIHKGFVCT